MAQTYVVLCYQLNFGRWPHTTRDLPNSCILHCVVGNTITNTKFTEYSQGFVLYISYDVFAALGAAF